MIVPSPVVGIHAGGGDSHRNQSLADPCGIETGFKKLATASTKGVNAPGPFAAGLGGKVSQPLPGR